MVHCAATAAEDEKELEEVDAEREFTKKNVVQNCGMPNYEYYV